MMTGNSGKRVLPPLPHPDHLRKQAKIRLAAMRTRAPSARLTEAQALLAREYGFRNWAELQAEVARRAASPLGRHAWVQRAHLAPLDSTPGFGDPPDEEGTETRGFILAGAVAHLVFLLAVLAGVGLVFWVMHRAGLPFFARR